MTELARRLDEYATLERDWDSYNGDPIAPVAIATARAWLRISPSVSWVVPMGNGGVQVEWQFMGREVELEIHPDGSMNVLSITGSPKHKTYIEEDGVSVVRVLELLS